MRWRVVASGGDKSAAAATARALLTRPRGQPRASGRGVWSGGWPPGGAADERRAHGPLGACWRHRAAAGLDGKEGAALDLERVPVGAVDARRAEEQLGERHAVDGGDLLARPVVPHRPRARLHGEGGQLRRRRLGQLRAAPLPCYPQRVADAAQRGTAQHDGCPVPEVKPRKGGICGPKKFRRSNARAGCSSRRGSSGRGSPAENVISSHQL